MPKIKLSYILKHLTFFYVVMLAQRLHVQDLYCLLFYMPEHHLNVSGSKLIPAALNPGRRKKHLERAFIV